jgi:SNF2 family DNA or RNA helicase
MRLPRLASIPVARKSTQYQQSNNEIVTVLNDDDDEDDLDDSMYFTLIDEHFNDLVTHDTDTFCCKTDGKHFKSRNLFRMHCFQHHKDHLDILRVQNQLKSGKLQHEDEVELECDENEQKRRQEQIDSALALNLAMQFFEEDVEGNFSAPAVSSSTHHSSSSSNQRKSFEVPPPSKPISRSSSTSKSLNRNFSLLDARSRSTEMRSRTTPTLLSIAREEEDEAVDKQKRLEKLVATMDKISARLSKSVSTASTSSSSSAAIQSPLHLTNASLRDYQLIGLQWLYSLYNTGMNAILADEMVVYI